MTRLLTGYIILFLLFCNVLKGQTKAELEEQRKKALEEIAYVDKMIKTTVKEKTESISELRIIGNKLNLRESVLEGLHEEMLLINGRIGLNSIAIEMMEDDLNMLRQQYAKSIINSYKTRKGNTELGYILSAGDFNQGYKRLKYLQQVAKFRRKESELIAELKEQIESTQRRLEDDLKRISDLKEREEQQKKLLEGEQNRRQRIIRSLASKEKQLQKELEEKREIAMKIEAEIAKIIEEERRRSIETDIAAEERLISDDFIVNKGRLPWPVERGVITSQFGIQNHPVLKYVTEDNIGIEITSSGETEVRSIFKGEVARVFSIPGANMAVIVSHGKFYSVYQNIVDVKVKKGEKVETKQMIGKVFNEPENGNKSILKFMIFEEKKKQNPELWISKKNQKLQSE